MVQRMRDCRKLFVNLRLGFRISGYGPCQATVPLGRFLVTPCLRESKVKVETAQTGTLDSEKS